MCARRSVMMAMTISTMLATKATSSMEMDALQVAQLRQGGTVAMEATDSQTSVGLYLGL